MEEKLVIKVAMGLELVKQDAVKDVRIYCDSCQGWVKYVEGTEACHICSSGSKESKALNEGLKSARTIVAAGNIDMGAP